MIKTMDKKLKNDTTINISDAGGIIGDNVFEYNVNMSVSFLSSARKSKIFQKIINIIVVLLTLVFVLVCTQLRREVQSLEAQITSASMSLENLLLKYERLSRTINRNNYRKKKQLTIIDDDDDYDDDDDDDDNNEEDIYQSLMYMTNLNNDYNNLSAETIVNNGDKHDEEDKDTIVNIKQGRYSRSIVTVDRGNSSEGTSVIVGDDIRVGRARRDEARGKQQRLKTKRKLKGGRRRLGPLFATFIGGVPEQHITDAAYIGPWVKRNESGYGFNKFHLVEDKKSIEVTTNGLYMISVQIFYLGEASHFSYWILLDSEGNSHTRRLTKCSTSSTVAATEASCHTTVTIPMKRGDRFHIEQQERNRLVNLQEGYSYIQVMLLSTDQGKKRP